jgi:hypothetical protein
MNGIHRDRHPSCDSCYNEARQKIEEFVDERNKSWCIHCGAWLSDVPANDDHVPTKSILHKPRPHHLPTVKVCSACNLKFSKDEQYFVAFLNSVLGGSTDPSKHPHSSASRALAESTRLRERIERSRSPTELREETPALSGSPKLTGSIA